MKLTNQSFNINTSEDDYSSIINNQKFLYQTSIEDYNTYSHETTISKPKFDINSGLFYTIDTKVYDENGDEISSKHTNEDFHINNGIFYYGNGSIFDIELNKGAYMLHLDSDRFVTQFNGGHFFLGCSQIDYAFGHDNIDNRFWMQDSNLQLWSKVNGKDDYAAQIMAGNTWFKSDTEDWIFGINASAPNFYIYRGQKDADRTLNFNLHNWYLDIWSKPTGNTKEQYKLYLSPGGTVINTYNGGNETIFNQSPSNIKLQSIIPNTLNAILDINSSSAYIQAQVKNPVVSADLFINPSIGGLKYQNPANLHQLTFGDNITSDIFTDLSTGLQYINYFDGNNNVYDTTNKFVKLNVTKNNFTYEYKNNNINTKLNATQSNFIYEYINNDTNTKLNIAPNNCYILSSGERYTNLASFNLELHWGQLKYTNVSYNATGMNTDWTLNATYTTDFQLVQHYNSNPTFLYTCKTTDYNIDYINYEYNFYHDTEIKIGGDKIYIHVGDGNYNPKSIIDFNSRHFLIAGLYNNYKYNLIWQWALGNTTDGLYGSIVNATTSEKAYDPVLKGFKVYDEYDNLISNSYLPLTGGTLTGNLYIDPGTIDTFDNLKKKSTFNPGMIYLEMRDSTDSTEMARISLDPRNDIEWSRKKLSDDQPKTTTYINHRGYYLTTYDDNNNSDSIYIQSGQLELVNNRVTDTSHPRGQINLSTNGLEVQKKDTATGQLIGNVKIDCFGLPQVHLYSCPANGDNTKIKSVTLDPRGLRFGETDTIQNLYLTEDGIGCSTKKSYGKKFTSYLTKEETKIEYEKTPEENIIETDTILFKPDTDDSNKIKFVLSHNVSTTINDIVESTKHSVIIYNGHTSTTQTNFDDADYITKKYSDEQYEDLLERYIALEARVRALEPPVPIEKNVLKTISTDNINFEIYNQGSNDDYTIDWGDNNTSLSGDGTNLSHNYTETDNYTITITPNNDNASGTLINLQNDLIELNIEDIECTRIVNDTTIQKIIVDNLLFYYGSDYVQFIKNASALEELHIREHCSFIDNYGDPHQIVENCSALAKATIDIALNNANMTFFVNCPNLVEVHLTSTTIPTAGQIFDTIPTGLTIYVPSTLLNDYQTALPNYATYMVGE